jgi:4a-hydroxytetrahydrobiopterin dehydratase
MQQASRLSQKHCVPCEGGVDPLKGEKLAAFTPAVPDWTVVDEKSLQKEFAFKNFKEAIAFINKVADLAESEGHHPDIFLHNWNKVTLTLSTHAINGLSENDFILAVKTNQIFDATPQ